MRNWGSSTSERPALDDAKKMKAAAPILKTLANKPGPTPPNQAANATAPQNTTNRLSTRAFENSRDTNSANTVTLTAKPYRTSQELCNRFIFSPVKMYAS